MDVWNNTAIVGIGATEFSFNGGRSELSLAAEACKAAIEDASLNPDQVDGITRFTAENKMEYEVAQTLGLRNLRFQGASSMGGSLAAAGTVILASMAVATGIANYVLRSVHSTAARGDGSGSLQPGPELAG